MNPKNKYGQSIGYDLAEWKAPPFPERQTIEGQFCQLEPLDVDKHAAGLLAADALEENNASWTYLPYGPFENPTEHRKWLESVATEADPQFYAVIVKSTGEVAGVLSYLRIDPKIGSIEVGHLHFSCLLRKTPAATEAIYMLMDRAFDLGYRRFEWKCDSLNTPSCRAAERFGFTFEGVFRQATVYKNRNRDTAWYSVIDSEWPRVKAAFLKWLAPENFDENENQRVSLRELTGSVDE